MYTQLFNLARATRSFLQRTLIPALRGRAKRSLCQQSREGLVISLTSPLAGAIPAKFAERLRGDAPLQESLITSLNIGILNPGRNGLSNPANDNVLWWRLWEIASATLSMDINLLVLPYPRLPLGARLPSDFPFVFIGRQTTACDSVRIFVQPEISSHIVLLDSVGCDRVLWVKIMLSQGEAVGLLADHSRPDGGLNRSS